MGSEGFEATESLGAAFMGLVISAILFGITTLQVYIYYQYYPEDKLQNRIVVPLLWIVDVFHLALIIHACYIYLVNQVSLDVIIWSMRGELLVTELIAVAVTTLYTTRIWNFARKPRHHLLWLLVVAQLLQLAAAIIEIYACYVCATLADMDRYLVEIRFGLTAHAFVDCFLAAVMCYYLQIGRTGFSAMDGTVVKLMQYVVSSGLATAICAVATIIAVGCAIKTMLILPLLMGGTLRQPYHPVALYGQCFIIRCLSYTSTPSLLF
ncbi:hypothetical protein PILCRDRAFT_814561 [Piloderma croceum F 1598]|uniref:DUF6534 domain-containing protein n=1 Tax=Piloderma croceum (strain F 1598) TaxID=765440 RepID=A0A0C3G7U7_PILCF|nr:hypothetical protein PILCRDRAFT_814561 [Piloderma croceum F 1598]